MARLRPDTQQKRQEAEPFMTAPIPPALRALLERLIDYAGTFPPAALPCGAAATNYATYRTGDRAWVLRWLVVSGADLDRIPAEFDGTLSVLSDADSSRAAALETRRVVVA